eukprot:5700321-Pyramimonas_sp.AAC.1
MPDQVHGHFERFASGCAQGVLPIPLSQLPALFGVGKGSSSAVFAEGPPLGAFKLAGPRYAGILAATQRSWMSP